MNADQKAENILICVHQRLNQIFMLRGSVICPATADAATVAGLPR
jgi:hypothetical protein